MSTVGLDSVTFGMSVAAAETATNSCLVPDREVNRECYFARPAGGPDGVAFLVSEGTIERVDIFAGDITTRSGAGIGTTEQTIRDLFGDRIQERPHPTGAADKELLFVPVDETDQQFRVIFEIEDGVVARYRSGRLSQVDVIDPCPIEN